MSIINAGNSSRASGRSHFSLWLGLAFVIALAGYATAGRLSQLSAWKDSPALYIAAGVPMMTTLDAYYSLRLARLHAAGAFVPHGPAPARHYSRPEQGSPGEWYDQREPKFLPLLSRAIAAASLTTAEDIDKAGLLLPPLLSSLFMIPLFLCCWRLGAPAAGIMGGLIATFCLEYYRRTSVGWVDTDALNLFFPWTVSFLILTMTADLRRDRLLLLAATAGAVLYVYYLWYPKPAMALIYAGAMAAHLLLARVPWRRCVLCVAVLIVFANPAHLGSALPAIEDFVERYLLDAPAPQAEVPNAIRFPPVWSTITEAQSLGWAETLRLIVERADYAVIGLAAFVPFALWRWRAMPAMAPVLLLGALALFSSRRFVPYLAPFVGIGWGLIIAVLIRGILGRSGVAQDADAAPLDTTVSRPRRMVSSLSQPQVRTTIGYVAVVVVFIAWLEPTSGKRYVPPPAVPAPVFRDLQILADRLPANARIWTWWDLGFAIVDTTRFGVYHDGAAQYTAQTNFIAASFVHFDPRVMHALIGFVDREGNRGIHRLASRTADFDDLVARMSKSAQKPSDVPIYVLFTPDMLHKYSSMRYLATPAAAAKALRGVLGIRALDCQFIADEKLHCGTGHADFRTGLLTGEWPQADDMNGARLRRALIIEKGRVLREREYANSSGPTIQIVFEAGGFKAAYLLDEPAYRSNLNQMFVLGRLHGDYFEEVFNDFPYARVYRVIAKRDGGAGRPP